MKGVTKHVIRLVALAGCLWMGLGEALAVPTVSIDQSLYFQGEGGTLQAVAPGRYAVSQTTTEKGIVLILTSSQNTYRLQAEAKEHEGELPAPFALTLPEGEDIQIVLLLLPDGSGFEAEGSVSGIQSRGMRRSGFRRTGLPKALQTLRPPRGTRERLGKSSPKPSTPAGPLKAVKSPSKEVQRLHQGKGPANAPRTPSVGELLNVLKQLPGGREQVERARKLGARISSQWNRPSTDWITQLQEMVIPSAHAQGPFAVTLTPQQPVVGPHHLSFNSVGVPKDSSIGFHSTSNPMSAYNSKGYLWVQIPATGWYIVNVQARSTRSIKAELKHFDPDSSWWYNEGTPPVQTWGYPQTAQPTIRSYPALVQLEAGFHELQFRLKEGLVTFLDISIQQL